MREDDKESKSMKDKFSTGLSDLGNKARQKAQDSIKSVEEKSKQAAVKGVNKVAEKATEVITSSMDAQKSKDQSANHVGRMMQDSGRRMEDQVRSWYGWFWSTITYGFIIILSFMIASSDRRFSLLPIILLIGFPFYLYYAIINSIPEIKIGNRVIFSRKNLSVRQQLSFTKQVARVFSTEMLKNSPMGSFLILAFLILLAYVVISPFILS